MNYGFITGAVSLDILPDGKTAILKKDVLYIDKAGDLHHAPTTMITDGKSVGRWAYTISNGRFSTPYLRAYMIHDHKCKLARALPAGPERDEARLKADLLLLECMESLGANLVEYKAVYRCVRLYAVFTKNKPVVPYELGWDSER